MRSLRISHVGLRGIVGGGLTPEHVTDFAAAFATFLEAPGPVLVGRDPRASGLMIREGVIAALAACGRDVIDLGVVSTPVVQHAIRRLEAAGGISIGASHNAAEWNALKFLGRRGTYLATADAAELLDIYHLRKFAWAEWNRLGQISSRHDAIEAYVNELAGVYDLDGLGSLRVLIDCCGGTSALVLRAIAERSGFRPILLNERLEGKQFAHEPNTSAATVARHLAPLMRPANADIGFLFDIDADRVAMATSDGQPVSEELMLPLLADYFLPKSPGKLVITNLSTTALVEEIAARHGGEVVRVPVGRQAAMDALAMYPQEEIALAGEGTGAVMMPQFRFVYDGIASMLAVLSMMRERKQSLAEILREYPRYSIVKGQVPLVSQRLPALFAEIETMYPDGRVNRSDGLRIDWPDHWFHVRASQTEPVVRVIVEQRGSEPGDLYEELTELVKRYAA
jgi:phosphomannomutase